MKIKAKILSPVHIRKERCLKEFNFIQDKDVYIFDEFECFEFLSKGEIEKVKNNSKRIIKSSIEIKKNEVYTFMDYFDLEENSYKVYIPASSIKGAIRTAYENAKKFKNENFQKLILKDIKKDFDTKIYKSINIKICKNVQMNRKKRVKELMQYVECLISNQEFEFEIEFRDKKLRDFFVRNMNNFYFDKYIDDTKKAKTCKINDIECDNCEDKGDYLDCDLYFYNESLPEFDKNELMREKKFLINIGHFGGAIKKSKNYRRITSDCGKNSKFTTAKTYALDMSCNDNITFEKSLVPFGWVLCEMVGERRN